MSLISMISESQTERFARLLKDYRDPKVSYRILVQDERKFSEHRKLHSLIQQVHRRLNRPSESDAATTHTNKQTNKQEFKKGMRSSSPEDVNEILILLQKRWMEIFKLRKYEIGELKEYKQESTLNTEEGIRWSDTNDISRIINVRSKRSHKTCLHKMIESEEDPYTKLLKIGLFVFRTEGFLDLSIVVRVISFLLIVP